MEEHFENSLFEYLWASVCKIYHLTYFARFAQIFVVC